MSVKIKNVSAEDVILGGYNHGGFMHAARIIRAGEVAELSDIEQELFGHDERVRAALRDVDSIPVPAPVVLKQPEPPAPDPESVKASSLVELLRAANGV